MTIWGTNWRAWSMALDGDFKMRTSHKLTQLFLAASVMVCVFMFTFMTTTALGADPGAPYPATSAVSDQKAGSVLVFNFYTSSPFGGAGNNTQNTRFNITNTNPALTAFIHIFFVAETCAVADYHACLTPRRWHQIPFFLQDSFRWECPNRWAMNLHGGCRILYLLHHVKACSCVQGCMW